MSANCASEPCEQPALVVTPGQADGLPEADEFDALSGDYSLILLQAWNALARPISIASYQKRFVYKRRVEMALWRKRRVGDTLK